MTERFIVRSGSKIQVSCEKKDGNFLRYNPTHSSIRRIERLTYSKKFETNVLIFNTGSTSIHISRKR